MGRFATPDWLGAGPFTRSDVWERAQEMALPPCDDLLYACGVIGVHRVKTLEQARLRLHAMAGLPVKPIEAGEFALQGSHGPGHVAD